MTLPGLADILKAHEEALEKGREMAAAQEHPDKLAKLLEEQRAAERLRLNHRIDSLVKERDRTAARFAAEIDRERETLARLDAEIAGKAPPPAKGGRSKKKG